MNELLKLDSGNLNIIDSIFKKLSKEMERFLGLKSQYTIKKFQVNILNRKPEIDDVFNYGIHKLEIDHFLILKIFENDIKFLPFILLRELLWTFLPNELRNNESINIIINQFLMYLIDDSKNLDDWRSFIRSNLNSKQISDFDRFERFFKYQKFVAAPNPIQFFFNYMNNKKGIVSTRNYSFFYLFTKVFGLNVVEKMIENELVETIRIIIKIFYNTKFYRNLLQYKKFFQNYKKIGLINTNLSLRKFSNKMDWIKSSSYISPSYQVNWNAIGMGVIVLYIRFNPNFSVNKLRIIIQKLPFILAPKNSVGRISNDLIAYIVFPIGYLEDLILYLDKLKKYNYISKYYSLIRISIDHSINLNYFREDFVNSVIIDPNHGKYKYNNIIEFKLPPENEFHNPDLTLLDFIILDRIRWFSPSSLGFESRKEDLKSLKSDLLNEIIKKKTVINELTEIFRFIYGSPQLKYDVVNFIEKYKKNGYYFLKSLLEIVMEISKIFFDQSKKKNLQEFTVLKNSFSSSHYSNLLENNIITKSLKNKKIQKLVKQKFELQINGEISIIEICNNLLKIFSDLRIFNLNYIVGCILNEKKTQNLIRSQNKEIDYINENFKFKQISKSLLDKTLSTFIESDPPVISPLLINTIITKHIIRDYLQIIVKKKERVAKILSNLKFFFPRILIYLLEEYNTNERFYYIEISTPLIRNKELLILVSILYNKLKRDLIYAKNHIWSGIISGFSSRQFYIYDKKSFAYSNNLFDDYFKFTRSLIQEEFPHISIKPFENYGIFLKQDQNFRDLIKLVNNRAARENNVYDYEFLKKLDWLNRNLVSLIKNDEEFVKIKGDFYYKNYIKSIEFVPNWKKFDLNQHVIYFLSKDLNDFDFRMFKEIYILNIEYPACVDQSIPILMRYLTHSNTKREVLFPKLESNLVEYFGFLIKKIRILFHFELNITPEGWDYDSSIFKEHLQNVLFDQEYDFDTPYKKFYQFTRSKEKSHFGLNSLEFDDLCEIFSYKSVDIKSFIGTKKVRTIERIQNLLEKGLIFPYIKLKNLGFQEHIYIILPNLDEKSKNLIVRIFEWFNYGYINEIEGKYYIFGFDNPIEFATGLMMKIYFPKCELAEFKQIFDMIFEYLDIEHYLILKDFVNGKTLVKNIYEDPDFFESYHPLRNIKLYGEGVNK